MRSVPDVAALLELEGEDLGHSDWTVIDQAMIDQFADLTTDHQWIHVDVEQAKSGPFGSTIAHGMLTLSYVPVFVGHVLAVEKFGFGLNYGFEKIRFTAPVPAGSRIRGHVRVKQAAPVEGGAKVTFAVQVDVEGSERAALHAEQVIIWRD